MAVPTTLNGTQLYIKIGDGASPEVFTHPCLINASRGVTFRSSNNTIIVPDCDAPEDPAWQQVVKDALSVGINGEGILDLIQATIDAYNDWWKSTTPKNVQVWLGTLGYWQAAFHLTEWSITGERGNKATVSLTLESDGEVADFATS